MTAPLATMADLVTNLPRFGVAHSPDVGQSVKTVTIVNIYMVSKASKNKLCVPGAVKINALQLRDPSHHVRHLVDPKARIDASEEYIREHCPATYERLAEEGRLAVEGGQPVIVSEIRPSLLRSHVLAREIMKRSRPNVDRVIECP